MVFYKVLVDDNFHFMGEDERYTAAEYATAEEAISHCKRIVDDYLHSAYKPGMSADELWRSWSGFGENPWISGPTQFAAEDYTRERCAVLCAG